MSVIYRPAGRADVPRLATLEKACFDYDALSQRNFTWMLTRGHAHLVVADHAGELLGYALVLYKRGTSLARLYSIAVHPAEQGKGIARALMNAVEQEAIARDCVYLRLEVRTDNRAAIALYERLGYHRFGLKHDYYEDHADALCMEKRLAHGENAFRLNVPYYAQTTEFTCGPASLLMALHALDEDLPLSQHQELQLWREATTIFMTSGHGGCGPHGLALAAHRRGFRVDMYVNQEEELFVESVRSEKKKQVIRLVEQDFKRQLAETDVVSKRRPRTVEELMSAMRAGGVPIVLISSYQIARQKAPHWVVLTGFDDDFIYFHDPEMDEDNHDTPLHNTFVPVRRQDFSRIARFGRAQLRAMLVVSRRA